MSDTTRADEVLLVSETGQVREVRSERQDELRKAPKHEKD
jgi:hypothetical protein